MVARLEGRPMRASEDLVDVARAAETVVQVRGVRNQLARRSPKARHKQGCRSNLHLEIAIHSRGLQFNGLQVRREKCSGKQFALKGDDQLSRGGNRVYRENSITVICRGN